MKTKTLTSVGALHPLLFFMTVYVVALLLSIFICSSIFYSLNNKEMADHGNLPAPAEVKKEMTMPVATAVVLR